MKSAYEQLKDDEGFSGTVYQDTVGKNTVGYGRNLDDNPLTMAEANYLLQSDLKRVAKQARKLTCYKHLNSARKNVIINMIFNMGIGSFNTFKRMIAALYVCDYELAAVEMLDSKWSKQVGNRANRLAVIMRDGE